MNTNAKFKIGDKVHCYRKDSEQWSGFDFVGVVTSCGDAGDERNSAWEYSVTNAPKMILGFPILIWESEMELANETKS